MLLLSRGQPHSQNIMARHTADWVLLYQDAVAQVWGRRDRYDNEHDPHYIAPSERIVGDAPQTGSATWPALPRRSTPGVLAKTYQLPSGELVTHKFNDEQ